MNYLLSALYFGGGLVGLLITLLIACGIFYLIWWIVEWMKIPPPGNMVVRIIVGAIAIVFLLHLLGVY